MRGPLLRTLAQRYCTDSNLKVQRDYFKAMDVIMQERGGERVMT